MNNDTPRPRPAGPPPPAPPPPRGRLVLGGSCIFLFVTKLRVYLCRSISFMA